MTTKSNSKYQFKLVIKVVKIEKQNSNITVFEGVPLIIIDDNSKKDLHFVLQKNRFAVNKELASKVNISVNKYYTVKANGILNIEKNNFEYFEVKSISKKVSQVYKKQMISFIKDNLPIVSRLSTYDLSTLFQKYQYNTLHELASDPDALDFVFDIDLTLNEKEYLQKYTKMLLTVRRITSFLRYYSLDDDENRANAIFNDFYSDASTKWWNSLEDILNNPYILGQYGYHFKEIDKIAFKRNLPYDCKFRYNSLIVLFLKDMFRGGYFSLPVDLFYIRIKLWLKEHSGFNIKKAEEVDESMLDSVIDALIKYGRIIITSRKNGVKQSVTTSEMKKNGESNYLIYLNEMYAIETNVLSKIQDRIAAPKRKFSLPLFKKLIKEFEEGNHVKLLNEQVVMLTEALHNKIFIVTGAAGTGKSLLISAYAYLFPRLFPRKPELLMDKKPNSFYEQILCVSPTGKAAQNLSKKVVNSFTIHKAFNIIPGLSKKERFYVGDCLVIDEASMVDTGLLSNILDHTSDDTQIILVGDRNQLPPVNSGTPFLDLLKSKKIPCGTLHVDFRQKENTHLLSLSNYVLGTNGSFDFNQMDDDIHFIKTDNDDETREKYIDFAIALYKQGQLDNSLLLCAKHAGTFSSNSMNTDLRNLINPKSNKAKHAVIGGKKFFCGDHVIQTKNRYFDDCQIMNGTLGTVVGFKRTSPHSKYNLGLRIKFVGIDHEVNYVNSEDLESVDLGYIMTVHKAQGSEASTVVFPIFDFDYNMLNRSLIYTAVTRAKQKITFIGNKKLFEESLNKIDSVENQGLTLRLAKN